ncbi:MAG: FtsQ-type POTRA domain-containing protein [Chthoniobacterales bacterium]
MRASTIKKSENRRLSRQPASRKNQHLLDVKVRSRTARKQRNRRINKVFLFFFILAIVVVGGYFGSTHLLNRFFFQNPAYALLHLDVELDGTMNREEFLKETGIKEGSNIFSINLANVEARLSKDPRISSVHLERTLPDKISVTIAQRHPIAWISLGDDTATDTAYLVGMDGVLMKPKIIPPEYLALPVIKGIDPDDLHEGEVPSLPVFTAALELIQKNNDSAGAFLKIRTIDTSKGYRLEVLNDQNAQVYFGLKNLDDQLKRLNILLTHCQETNRQIKSVNLMIQKNTPVRFVMTETVQHPKTIPGPATHSTSKSTQIQ